MTSQDSHGDDETVSWGRRLAVMGDGTFIKNRNPDQGTPSHKR